MREGGWLNQYATQTCQDAFRHVVRRATEAPRMFVLVYQRLPFLTRTNNAWPQSRFPLNVDHGQGRQEELTQGGAFLSTVAPQEEARGRTGSPAC